MPLLAGDIRFALSANMADVPEGGGPPSATLMTSGRSNELFPDISEETRTVGRTEIYSFFSVLRNADRAMLGGANLILAEPPADPRVSVTLLTLKDPFATRADIVRRIESGMSPGSEWAGYLLENHSAPMRSVTLLQRPGMSPPTIGRTYILVYNEGLAGERRQRITIKSVDVQVRMFTEIINNQLVDFQAQVVSCELMGALQYDFPGSPPSRLYARQANKTMVRETVYSDSGMFYSASRLTAPTAINDTWLQVASVYAQIVPNSRTEAAAVDQRPASRQVITLAAAPRKVEVGITPHTQRIKITEVNAGQVFVLRFDPPPEPNTVFIDFYALGQRYTLSDDGNGQLKGAGGGAVSYLTGIGNVTLKAVPDIGSSLAASHGSRVSYTDRSAQGASVRPPEYAWQIEAVDPADRIVPGSLTLRYLSGGVLRTVTDNGTGLLTGAGAGVVDYPSRNVLLRPSFMPDALATIEVECDFESVVTDLIAAPAPDAGGFVALALSQQPAAGTLQIQWATSRSVSATSGGELTPVSATKQADDNQPWNNLGASVLVTQPVHYEPPVVSTIDVTPAGGGPISWPWTSTPKGRS